MIKEKLPTPEKKIILEYLRYLPAKETEDLLNYIFMIVEPKHKKEVCLKMHDALSFKVQRRLEKQIVDLCKMQARSTLRDYIDRAFIKVFYYLRDNEKYNKFKKEYINGELLIIKPVEKKWNNNYDFEDEEE